VAAWIRREASSWNAELIAATILPVTRLRALAEIRSFTTLTTLMCQPEAQVGDETTRWTVSPSRTVRRPLRW
jgi:hypothetical protein